MTEDNWETNYRKNLTAAGSSLLVGSIFTGPAAPVVAAIGVGLIIGRVIRGKVNKKSQREYDEERLVIEENNSERSFYPEPPETAIAKETPFEASRLLKQLSKDETTRYALNSASSMVHDYLSEVPKERLANSNGIYINFERKRNLTGLILGEDSVFNLEIELK